MIQHERARRKILIFTQVLAKQPDITEDQKSRIMAKISHTMHKIQDDESLVSLFSLPEQTVPSAETECSVLPYQMGIFFLLCAPAR